MNTDNSTNYLLNHAHELDYNNIRIINLYSTVFKEKPSTKRLHESDKNMKHIQSLLAELNPKDTDFVLACVLALRGAERLDDVQTLQRLRLTLLRGLGRGLVAQGVGHRVEIDLLQKRIDRLGAHLGDELVGIRIVERRT